MKEKLNSLKRLQKGELEGVLIYKKLEKYAPNEEIAKIFNQLAVDEIKNIHTKKSSFKLRILCKNGNVVYPNQQRLILIFLYHKK